MTTAPRPAGARNVTDAPAPVDGADVRATTVRAGCKVNLGLRITGVRPDGYHELDSFFCPLAAPFDLLHFEENARPGHISVSCATAGIDPTRNTLTKAHAAYARRTGFAPGVRIHLTKGIPHGAGLGGGSSDAAAVLRWCNERAPQPLASQALAEVALSVGADVPFFLHNVPCRVRGIGERINPCPAPEALPWAGCWLLLLCPPEHISTPWAYTAWDTAHSEKKIAQEEICALTSAGVGAKEVDSCTASVCNDFEAVVFAAFPRLGSLKAEVLRLGAAAAVMSGSGASLAGIFRHQQQAQAAATHLSAQGVQVFISAL